MAFVNGVGFLVYFVIEVLLTFVWIIKFKLYVINCQNLTSFFWYARWALSLTPLLSACDNLRLFLGAVLPENAMSNRISEHYFVFVLFLHTVLIFPLLIFESAIFVTRDKFEQQTGAAKVSYAADDDSSYQIPSKKRAAKMIIKSVIWAVAVCVILALAFVGIFSFNILKDRNIFVQQYHSVWEWQSDEVDDEHVIVTISEQQPLIAAALILAMNIAVGVRYKSFKFWLPFMLTLVTIIGNGVLMFAFPTLFFYFGNLLEFVLYLGFFLLDCFMYPLQDPEQEDALRSRESYQFYEQL